MTVCGSQNGKRRSLSRDLTEGPPFHPRCRCEEELVDDGIAKADPVDGDGDGFIYYNELTPDQVKQLSDAVNALSEPLSQLTAAVI